MKYSFSGKLSMLIIVFLAVGHKAQAQRQTVDIAPDSMKKEEVNNPVKKSDHLAEQYDFGNLVSDVLHPKKQKDPLKKSSGITVIPNIAANPTIGLQAGIKAVAGRILGTDSNTLMSVASTSASITTKGIIYFYINHNAYTPHNKWNFQGSLVVAKTLTPDYGLGIGNPSDGSTEDKILANAERKGRALHSMFYTFKEKVYKEVAKNLFAGVGVAFDVRRDIEDKVNKDSPTPYLIYSQRHGFDPTEYSSNGMSFNLQYTTRDNQNRAYKGLYADIGFRANQTWLGSTRAAALFTTDVRKYISLSVRNPEHVVALWNWGSYIMSGNVPYLELPGTAKDPTGRSGRGYVVGYFKGTKYNYSEVEYRFPITRNKFLSGVAFGNLQTANDESGTKIFTKFEPGYGGGFRVLFNKATRTNLCVDYAFGVHGSKGFFLNLNEAF